MLINIHQFDTITLSETRLKDNVNLFNALDIPSYDKSFRICDQVKGGGGVGYYLKADINV